MIESARDRRALINDAPDLALFATIPDALDAAGAVAVIVSRNVAGLFDRAYRQTGDFEGFYPLFLCLDEDAQFVKQYHRIMLKGQVFQVVNRQPDGTGFTQLVLRLLGPYRINPIGEAYVAGLPYILPIVLGGRDSVRNDETGVDPDNPRLKYPYTLSTYLDYTKQTAPL